MDSTSPEQLELRKDVFPDGAFDRMIDGMSQSVSYHDGVPVCASLPDTWTYEVIDADPYVKGQTQTAVFKNAVLANGSNVAVPAFIDKGERIVVDINAWSFVRRGKEEV